MTRSMRWISSIALSSLPIAPTAIEERIGRRDARRRGRLGVAHHGDEHIQRAARMSARQ
jgi:hypothetical protein